jgi:hypothetical protein
MRRPLKGTSPPRPGVLMASRVGLRVPGDRCEASNHPRVVAKSRGTKLRIHREMSVLLPGLRRQPRAGHSRFNIRVALVVPQHQTLGVKLEGDIDVRWLVNFDVAG